MPPGKKLPAAMVVVSGNLAPRHNAASEKLKLARKILDRTDDLEDVLAALLKIVRGDGSNKEILEAAKILLANSVGEPVKTQVVADVGVDKAGAAVSPLESLTSQQLADVATSSASPDSSDEVEDATFSETEP